jgi:hypothetical protein
MAITPAGARAIENRSRIKAHAAFRNTFMSTHSGYPYLSVHVSATYQSTDKNKLLHPKTRWGDDLVRRGIIRPEKLSDSDRAKRKECPGKMNRSDK